jgi:hypothetical protein
VGWFADTCRWDCSLTIEFEGRETQTAGSWRISVARSGSQETLENSAFQAITVMLVSGNRSKHHSVKVPVTQKIPWINFQAKNQNQNFQLESLILAQNERWRQA